MEQEKFIFCGQKRIVTGIDENGYGPLIGPLIITGVQLTTEFDSLYSLKREILEFDKVIKDSKKIFKRNLQTYRKGEQIALHLLRSAGKLKNDFFSLVKNISNYEASYLTNFNIPVWEDSIPAAENFLGSIKVNDLYVEIIDTPRFNALVTRFNNKAFIDFLGFKRVREQLPSDVYLMGKIGGMKYYRNFFMVAGENATAILEEHHISFYRVQHKELYFILNGDEEYLPITLAGILGKYIRELFMKSISELFGFEGTIPFASGYRHDPKTRILTERIIKSGLKERFIRTR